MEQRLIAGTDLRVSPLCLGTMLFGSPVEEKEAVKIVHLALEQGVNFIDTANMYEGYTRYVGSPGGVTEEILGKAMGGKREQAVLASKVGMKIGPGTGDEGLSRDHIRRECERSLARLATDWLDLYYMHKPDESTPIAESIETFAELIQAGKVRHWALSNFRAGQVREVLQVCDDGGWPRPVAHQLMVSGTNPAPTRRSSARCSVQPASGTGSSRMRTSSPGRRARCRSASSSGRSVVGRQVPMWWASAVDVTPGGYDREYGAQFDTGGLGHLHLRLGWSYRRDTRG